MNWVNGQVTDQIDVRDRGLQYGDGVFTTVRVHDATPVFLERHVDRIRRDCERLNIAAPDAELLRVEARRACTGVERGVMKIIVTRGVGGRGYRAPETATPTRIVQLFPWPTYAEDHRSIGARLRTCATRLGDNEALAGVKHLNRLEQVLARAEWSDAGKVDGVMLSRSGEVIETTTANLFVVHSAALATPGVTRCGVRGIMRDVILELAGKRGVPVTERPVSVEDLRRADEVFMTNCVIGIWPVRHIDAREYIDGPLTRALMRALAEFEPAYA